jgi:hypothetical protein
MIIEKQIEKAIMVSLAKLDLPGVKIIGNWDIVAEGEVKGQGDATGAVLAVGVAPRSYDGFVSPQADFACSLALTVRRDAYPTGEEVASITEPLFRLLDSWNRDEDAVFVDLTTDEFSPGGLQLTGGDGPEYDSSTMCWTVTQTFTIRGIIK